MPFLCSRPEELRKWATRSDGSSSASEKTLLRPRPLAYNCFPHSVSDMPFQKLDLLQGGKTEIDKGNTSGSRVCDEPRLKSPTTIHVKLPTRITTKCTVYIRPWIQWAPESPRGPESTTASTYGKLLVHASDCLTSHMQICNRQHTAWTDHLVQQGLAKRGPDSDMHRPSMEQWPAPTHGLLVAIYPEPKSCRHRWSRIQE